MKVLFDHQIFFQNQYGGIPKIFFEIFDRMEERKLDYECSVDLSNYSKGEIYSKSRKELINKPPWFSLYTIYKIVKKVLNIFHLSLPEFILNRESGLIRFSLKNQIGKINRNVIKDLTYNKYSVFHATYYRDYFLESLLESKTKFVLTVHDCVHELFPNYYGRKNFIIKNRERLCLAADHIVCVSESTKSDLLKIYPNIQKEKVSVIYNAGDLSKEPTEGKKYFEQDFILFVGNRGEYKNFVFLLEAFAKITDNNLLLVCAGGKDLNANEKVHLEKLNLQPRVVHMPFAEESTLANLYRQAKLFIYPSLYEGFGIPILESMSVGCPVLCSDIKVFREIANGAAAFFNPSEINSLVRQLQILLDSEKERETLRKKGYERVKDFSWKNCSDAYIEIYNKLSKN